ncbi:MAG: valine--tRNA ligase, partial [Clostridia bacterium]
INKNGGIYAGLDRIEARARIIEDLDKLSLLVKIEEIKHNVGKCYRCKNTIEPLTSSQWFVKMEELAKPAIDVVKKGEINFVPERFSKTYLNWMENVHDWCISRQLWWGHRIPAFYCDDCDTMTVSKKDIKVCPHCGSKKIHQDEDVLDTWFSSALWPFSTLGFPDKTEDLKYFYPTSVLVTGYDIIFFWVARMIFSGLHHMKEIPFKTVFLHGIVRDDQGRKMSKSLGNGIDPLEIIDEYGADALRFTLATGNSPGNDMRFYKERVEASGNFANKLWNAARFTLMNVTIDKITIPNISELHIEDRWILSKLNTLILEYTENLDKYEIGIAAAKLYDFTWEIFCDWYIELLKPRLYNKEDIKSNISAQNTICYVLMNILKLLHPIMPFITEEIWQCLPVITESIMISKFPTYNKEYYSKEIEIDMERVMGAIRNIRAIRTQMNVLPSKKTKLFIETSHRKLFNDVAPFFEKLAFASETSISESFLIKNAVTVICDGAKIFIPLEELVDVKEEIARLTLEVAKFDSEILRIEKKLSNEGFISKAPANVIDEEKAKLEKYTQMKNDSVTALNKYNKLQSN